MSNQYTPFQERILEALNRDVGAQLGFDISHLHPFYRGWSIAEVCRMGKWFDRLIIDGHCSFSSSIFDTLVPCVAKRFGNQWILDFGCDPYKVRAIKQYFDIFKKWEDNEPISSDEEVLKSFSIRVARSGTPKLSKMDPDTLSGIRARVRTLLGPVPDLTKLVPRHGPGAVADGSKSCQKWNFSCISEPLLYKEGLGSQLFHLSDRHWTRHPLELVPLRRWTSRSCVVPKDYRGGRVIAIEPKELQFLQQALKSYLYARLESRSRGEIQFTSQEFHVAKLYDPNSASIDLKDASDMVSRRLVSQLVPLEWWDLLKRLRSEFVVTGEKLTTIRAYALMGSALCFPIEALVHYAICREIVPSHYSVSVYGDDIIIPKQYYYDVVEHLRLSGLVPNTGKCCFRTPFRESCGTDLFGSVNVASTKLRREVKSLKTALDAQPIQREFWLKGFYHLSLALGQSIIQFAPLTSDPEPKTWELGYDIRRVRAPLRWNRDLQRLEVKLPRITLIDYEVSFDGYLGLFAWFCRQPLGSWKRDGSKTQYVPSSLTRVRCGWTPLF